MLFAHTESLWLLILNVWVLACVHGLKLRPRTSAFYRLFSEITFKRLERYIDLLSIFGLEVAQVRRWVGWSLILWHYWIVRMLLRDSWEFIMPLKRCSEARSNILRVHELSVTTALDRWTICVIIAPLAYDVLLVKAHLRLNSPLFVNRVAFEHSKIQRLDNRCLRCRVKITLTTQ